MERLKRRFFIYSHLCPTPMKRYETTFFFTISSSFVALSIHLFDDEKQYRYFSSSLYLHMFGAGNTRQINYIDVNEEGRYQEL